MRRDHGLLRRDEHRRCTADCPIVDEVDLGVETIEGVIILNAEAGWVWREGQTNRIVLDRDVQAEIGGSLLSARRADLWLKALGDGVYQVFGVFEDLTSSDSSFKGKRVPVRAVIRLQESIKLRLGARIDQQPTRNNLVQFMSRSSKVYQRRVFGIDAPDPSPQETAQALRWAPKELSQTHTQNQPSEIHRTLPVPIAGQKQSRVERALAQSRGEPVYTRQHASRPDDSDQTNRPTTQQNQQPADRQAGFTSDDTNLQIDPAATARAEQSPIFQASGIFSISIDGKVVAQGAQQASDDQEARPSTITAEGASGCSTRTPRPSRRWILRPSVR